MITIVDYGMGNVGSIRNMLKKIGVPCATVTDPADLVEASKLILPGVGAFDAGMKRLEESGLIPALSDIVLEKKVPILGICLGMQLMTQSSEEGTRSGLGWIGGRAVHFSKLPGIAGLKIPHMGWNAVEHRKLSQLTLGRDEEERFYFVHSYFVELASSQDGLMTTEYGSEFIAAFEVDNVFGVQFHPEKSQRFGLHLLKNFAEMH